MFVSLLKIYINFHKFITSYGSWWMSEFCYCSISWEQIDRIWPYFAYALILSRSRSGLLHINFCKFIMELWPLVNVRISFPLNILGTNWLEFDHIFHMHWYWQDLGWDCCTSIFTYLLQSYDPWLMPEFHYSSISWEIINRIWPNFVYALILKTSRLGLLHINFRKLITE